MMLRTIPHSVFSEIEDIFGSVFNSAVSLSPTFKSDKNDDGYKLQVKVPGFKKDEVKISTEGNVLTITGKRSEKDNWLEDFEKSIELPDTVDTGKISAELKEGILRITLPYKEVSKAKTITIN